MRPNRVVLCAFLALGVFVSVRPADAQTPAATVEYKVLATNRTSTMQKEMQDAGSVGFKFGGVMGGETSFGGSEVVVVMIKGGRPGRFEYRLLATNRTSTMQKELQDAGDAGYEYRGQSVFQSMFGGKEVVVILEKDNEQRTRTRYQYRLVSTKKTSTLQKELLDVGAQGFSFVGLTVADTAIGGAEVVAILRRESK